MNEITLLFKRLLKAISSPTIVLARWKPTWECFLFSFIQNYLLFWTRNNNHQDQQIHSKVSQLKAIANASRKTPFIYHITLPIVISIQPCIKRYIPFLPFFKTFTLKSLQINFMVIIPLLSIYLNILLLSLKMNNEMWLWKANRKKKRKKVDKTWDLS